jgi:hypothetical protein
MTATAEVRDDLQLLNQRQAAEVLAVNPRTMEGWRCRGDGPPFIRLGRVIRYRLQDLHTWLEDRTFQSTTEADYGRGT